MCRYKSLLIQSYMSVLTDGERTRQELCSYKSLLPQPCSQYSETERRTRQECAATSPYCLSPAVSTQRQREELDRNVQLQVLIASVLQSVLTDREKNQIGMCSYKSLLPQSCSQYSQMERRTRQECAATSPYCLRPAVGTHRRRVELDRNVQLQVLIASALSVSTHRQERRTRQECAATSPYCLSPVVSTQRQREELDRNVQLQVLIASVLQSVIKRSERRTRQECAATSPYCLSPAVGTHRRRVELDRNVQLQVLIASALQSVLRDREKNQIGMFSYKSLLPQPCSR